MALYCIIEQHGEKKQDWRPYKTIMLDNHKEIRIFTDEITAKRFLRGFKRNQPKLNLWLAKVDIGIVQNESEINKNTD